jgi:hypothetical protein
MPFDTKKTLEAWKKAKPLLLHNTGVSEVLRTLPANPTVEQLGEFAKIDKKLEAFMAAPKIKAEKKAFACIQLVREDIKKYMASTKDRRAGIVAKMQQAVANAQKYYTSLEKGPVTPALLSSFAVAMGPREIQSIGVDQAAVPQSVSSLWMDADLNMQDVHRVMTNIMADSARPKPVFDTKTAMAARVVAFKAAVGHLDRAYKAAKNLA